MSDFLAMGGYAAYVWPCYALTALVMLGLLVATLRRQRRLRRRLDALEGPGRRRGARTRPAEATR